MATSSSNDSLLSDRLAAWHNSRISCFTWHQLTLAHTLQRLQRQNRLKRSNFDIQTCMTNLQLCPSHLYFCSLHSAYLIVMRRKLKLTALTKKTQRLAFL